MKVRTPRRGLRLSAPARRCLGAFFEAELNGTAIEAYTWRAKNAERIKYVTELLKSRTIEHRDNTHYVVRFYGLLNLSTDRALNVLSQCERLFKALAKHYRANPKAPVPMADVAKRLKLKPTEILQAAQLLARSPAYLGIHPQNEIPVLQPNENYVTIGGFENLKEEARKEARLATQALPSLTALGATGEMGVLWDLRSCESESVRDCAQKAVERLGRDTEGAITLSRSMLEAACKYVLEEFGVEAKSPTDLLSLYKETIRHLKLDPHRDLDETLRRLLHGGIAMVDGLANLRNRAGDAHGKGRHSPRPAKRHADLAFMASTTIASFLLASLDARRSLQAAAAT